LEATITLEYSDEKTAEAIAKAVSPENLKTPVGLSVKTVRKDNCVVTEIKAEGKMATFIATIDDLLFSASTAEKALVVAKRN
jgi:tRNA threonylcarbamoyladenosine modification (KEOPS) complex  Pcc1 subunit